METTTDPTPEPQFFWLSTEQESLLEWIDAADSRGEIRVELLSDHPFPKDPEKGSDWLRDVLKEKSSTRGVEFFTLPLVASKRELHPAFLSENPTPRHTWVRLVLPLTELFSLPGLNPVQELGELREFLAWVDDKATANDREFHGRPRLQLFRGGNNSKPRHGLSWCGGRDEEERQELDTELVAWRQKPWFAEWEATMLEGVKKMRLKPHSWINLPSVQGQRREFEAMVDKGKIEGFTRKTFKP